MRSVLWVIVAFAAGTLPSPHLMALLARRPDVVKEMHRQDSPGDAHFLVTRRISKTLGVTAMVLDVLKGFIPALIAVRWGEGVTTVSFVGVAAVAGHSFAPFLRRSGGRGLTTAAGVSLAIIPWAMVGSGVIALGGTIAKRGGFGTSVGFGLLAVFAVAIGYPGGYVLMAVGITALISIRRLEGLEEDRREGIPLPRAILGRLIFDLPRGKRDFT
jgi:acyl phosphate:glycerol-3-phosphate acyltransferase